MGQLPYFAKDGAFMGSVESEVVERCRHDNRKDIGTCSDGCCDKYECLDCGKRFMVEVPS